MGWFRRRIRLGSHLALVALAFQLILTFAHVHLDNGARLQGYLQATPAMDGVRTSPQSPSAADDPFCSICLLLQMAASSVTPDTPALALRCEFIVVLPSSRTASLVAAAPHLLFNARAPPLA
jgi:hypothetical protein